MKLALSALTALAALTLSQSASAVTCSLPGDIQVTASASSVDDVEATLTVGGESIAAVRDCLTVRPIGRRSIHHRAYVRCPFGDETTRYEVYPEALEDFRGTELKPIERVQVIVWKGSNVERLVSESCQ